MEGGDLQQWWEWVTPFLRRMGPLSNAVEYAGMIATAGWAVISLCGFLLLPPPLEKRECKGLARVLGVVFGIMLAALYLLNRRAEDSIDLVPVAVASLGAGIVLFLGYLLVRRLLTYRCVDDEKQYLGGLRLQPDAKLVLAGDFAGLPEERQIKVGSPPKTAQAYFCLSDRDDPSWIWTKGSLDTAWWLMVVLYFVTMLALATGLSAMALELHEDQIEVSETATDRVVTIPTTLLFDFDTATIAKSSDGYLDTVARMLADAKVQKVRVVGHTDGFGEEAYNQRLSEQRAFAVRNWLVGRGGLANVAFEVSGAGEKEPKHRETDDNGQDRPEARHANRRVEVIFSKP
ncbi:Photosystem I P700 chlorophyll a apoprotein A2 [Ensifer sp. M14]|jgi:outer membrane protein OmpA-like peptidoglycan-associated protein|uniref:OmpA family protein n=1 Tax=Sinorhizobium/Ensifer group TaxID=227292 RepID=UPI000984B9E5|nr:MULTISPECIES: OmpA family protein [Sinorhizobium/Ensifer group]OOG74784.1 hypothetical protein B0E45_05125 [Sinorhizobium sp. A49]RDL47235.1 Photosystem I P700 chlorophyll a apoprotein A2 [Ensifer sp. M14]